jgi:hypothetical protein
MKRSGLLLVSVLVAVLSGCQSPSDTEFTLGDSDDCSGVTVVVNYGLLSPERDTVCVVFSGDTAGAKDLMTFAGYELTGTGTYGDQVVCRVNGLPSESEPFVVPGEDPYLETCADMPPAFGYWALWVKTGPEGQWAYAEEGVGTLELESGDTVGVVFSTAGETPTPAEG